MIFCIDGGRMSPAPTFISASLFPRKLTFNKVLSDGFL